MKLTTFILLISLMQVSAATFGQRVTLKQNNLTIDKVFREIRKQTGYDVLMGYGDFKASKINVNFENASLTEVMDVVVKNTELTYSIEEKTIVIKRKSPNFLDRISERLNAIDVSGRVVDADGRGLPGASVSIKGKSNSEITDANGNFYMKGVDEDAVLVISFIGYIRKEIKAAKDIGNIVLELSTSKLDEVQVIAYGTTTRRLSTSNITSIKGQVLEKQPISNLLLGLQGRVSGMYLNQTSGVSGADVQVRIQGQNSIANGNEAFYVIDGIPYTPQNLYSGISRQIFPGNGSTLSFINPADIESIEILKDADATAIYGSRAANGAILITTKKGKPGVTKIDLNLQNGWGQVAKKLKILNTEQYLEIRKEGAKNTNLPISSTDFDLNGAWDQNRYTDWQDKLIGNTSHYTTGQASISGGTNQTQFLASGGFIRETSVFLGNFADTKGNVLMNINHKSKDNKFEFTMSSNYLQDINKLPQLDFTGLAITLAPNAPDLYNPDGSVNWGITPGPPARVSFSTNPAISLLRKYRANTSNLLTNMNLSYSIANGLSLKANLGYNKLETDELSTIPQTSFSPLTTINLRAASYGTRKISSWIAEPQLTYSRSFNFGRLEALVGTTFQTTEKSVQGFDGSNYANDSQLENSLAAATILPNNANMNSEYRYNAIFGRINYQYDNKYIINITARKDGSSRFGSANLFHSFYSVGAAWLFGEEKWVKDNLKILNFGKLRISYGTTGNDQIQDYQFLSLFDVYNGNAVIPYQNVVALNPTSHSNPYLQWEETRKLNLGMELGFLNNRIFANINYNRNRSSNQLLNYALPAMTGFGYVLRNIPALVENKGWELVIDGVPIEGRKLKWTVSANLTIPKNKLLDYPNLQESSSQNRLVIGESTNIIKTYEFVGVNKQTGQYEFKTFDGKITSSPNPETDKTQIITMGPEVYGGVNNTLSYRNFDFSILFQYVKQMSSNYSLGATYPGSINRNQPVEILNRWQKNGDDRPIQQINRSAAFFNSFTAATQSNIAFSDASFLRLKNVSLSYSLPEIWTKKVGIASARIYVQGQNLATFTKFKGGDPEIGNVNILPPLRVITTGVQLTF